MKDISGTEPDLDLDPSWPTDRYMPMGIAHLQGMRIRKSMSRCGNCFDNAAVEAFFKTIQTKLIRSIAWHSRRHAERAIASYLDGFYNPVCRHSALGSLSPARFELHADEVS